MPRGRWYLKLRPMSRVAVGEERRGERVTGHPLERALVEAKVDRTRHIGQYTAPDAQGLRHQSGVSGGKVGSILRADHRGDLMGERVAHDFQKLAAAADVQPPLEVPAKRIVALIDVGDERV